MKRLLTIATALLLTITILAQSPEKMSYQAVVRNASDELVKNQEVGMQISILQGTADGVAVYTETQTPTANANGLVNIKIGEGTTTDDFSSIDWTSGPYFIKTETDPIGGTNYTIIGTSQLLSVPYALHSKTAETVTGTINETDPVFTDWDKSTGISITESQISDLQTYLTTETDPKFTDWDKDYADLTNKPATITTEQVDAITSNSTHSSATTGNPHSVTKTDVGLANVDNTSDASKPISTATQTALDAKADADNVLLRDNTTEFTPDADYEPATKKYVDDKALHYLGEEYLGGIIFYLYTGSDGQQHGLIVSKTESPGAWGGSTIVGANRTEDGAYNTNFMPSGTGTARQWLINNFDETVWYIPSIDELTLLWNNRFIVNKTIRSSGGTLMSFNLYWSSTEYGPTVALYFTQYGSANQYNKTGLCNTRAIRAF